MRNILLSTAVSSLVMVLGCWIAGWEVSDPEAAAIVVSTFACGLGSLLWLEERNPAELPPRTRER
jgi:hypothetical protein